MRAIQVLPLLFFISCRGDDGLLARRCAGLADCGESAICSRFYLGGQCTAQCQSDQDCLNTIGEDGICFPYSGFCKKSCQDNGQCPDGNHCSSYGYCEVNEPLNTDERENAIAFANAYCVAEDACECPSAPSDPSVPFGDDYFEEPDCVSTQIDNFLLKMESELAFSKGCFNERITALEQRDCSPEIDSFQWEKSACPIWTGERGLRESCASRGGGASDCAPGLYCIPNAEDYGGRCMDAYQLPGQSEECVNEPPRCAPNFYCEANLIGVDGWVCNQNPPVGTPCEGPWDCGGLACLFGTCEELTPPGSQCTEENDPCDYERGSYCTNGTCSEPVPLECERLGEF